MADGGWRMADGGWRMAARTQTAPSSAVRWLILKPGYRTDLGGVSNAPRLDAREEGGLSACSERLPENRPRAETGAKRGMTVGRQPASTGRLRAGRPETRVNSGLAGRQAGNARKQWAVGQGLRKRPFYAGFRAGVVAIVIVDLWQFLTAGGGDSAGDASLSLFSSCYLVSGALPECLQRCALLQPPRRCDKKMGAARTETGTNREMIVGRQPASIGRFSQGWLGTLVNTGLADRLPGTPRKQWAGGQGLRRCPFYAGSRAAWWRSSKRESW